MINKFKEKIMKIIRPERFVLPGYDSEGSEKTTFQGMMIFSVIMALLAYMARYGTARDRLYYMDYETGKKVLFEEGAVMADFDSVLSWSLAGFFVSAVVCLIYIGVRYAYLHKESKSIYLMRRLPRRGEILRRCTVVPLYRAFLCLIGAFILLVLLFTAYMISTPAQCIVPGQWAGIWR